MLAERFVRLLAPNAAFQHVVSLSMQDDYIELENHAICQVHRAVGRAVQTLAGNLYMMISQQ